MKGSSLWRSRGLRFEKWLLNGTSSPHLVEVDPNFGQAGRSERNESRETLRWWLIAIRLRSFCSIARVEHHLLFICICRVPKRTIRCVQRLHVTRIDRHYIFSFRLQLKWNRVYRSACSEGVSPKNIFENLHMCGISLVRRNVFSVGHVGTTQSLELDCDCIFPRWLRRVAPKDPLKFCDFIFTGMSLSGAIECVLTESGAEEIPFVTCRSRSAKSPQ